PAPGATSDGMPRFHSKTVSGKPSPGSMSTSTKSARSLSIISTSPDFRMSVIKPISTKRTASRATAPRATRKINGLSKPATPRPQSKILAFEDAAGVFARLRKQGKALVHCHGTFDLIHPGHIVHFEEAKALGDILVVTITGEKFVNKGPGRPYFNDQLRSRWLAALGCVDYVVVIPFAAAVEAIECVRAQFYCKGREYADPTADLTGN